MNEINIRITGTFDVNQLTRSLGDHLQFGLGTQVQAVPQRDESVDRLVAFLNGEDYRPPVQEVAEFAQIPTREHTMSTSELAAFIYGAPTPNQHRLELAVRGDHTIAPEMLGQHLAGPPIIPLNSVEEVIEWIPQNIRRGDRVILRDSVGNVVATYVH